VTRVKPPAYPPIVRSDDDRARFDRLYNDLIYVIGLRPADALLQATTQFQMGFDATGAKRKRRKRVHLAGPEGEHVVSPDDGPPG
jgi:hypothetical protein